jgi:hypothetical protein
LNCRFAGASEAKPSRKSAGEILTLSLPKGLEGVESKDFAPALLARFDLRVSAMLRRDGLGVLAVGS